jgi:hypothetical protein
MPNRLHGAWLSAVLGPVLVGLGACAARAPSQAQSQPAAPPKCEVAIVSPVSGNAECVRPRGAPVDPPPPRPDARCAPATAGIAAERACTDSSETER